MVQPRFHETASVTYYKNGQHDERALAAISRLFRDTRTNAIGPVDPALIDLLYDLRTTLKLPDNTPIHIIDGYREPASNLRLAKINKNTAKDSYHTRGMAADIRIPGTPGDKIVAAAKALKRGGVAWYPKTKHVHVDTGPVRTWTAK